MHGSGGRIVSVIMKIIIMNNIFGLLKPGPLSCLNLLGFLAGLGASLVVTVYFGTVFLDPAYFWFDVVIMNDDYYGDEYFESIYPICEDIREWSWKCDQVVNLKIENSILDPDLLLAGGLDLV